MFSAGQNKKMLWTKFGLVFEYILFFIHFRSFSSDRKHYKLFWNSKLLGGGGGALTLGVRPLNVMKIISFEM